MAKRKVYDQPPEAVSMEELDAILEGNGEVATIRRKAPAKKKELVVLKPLERAQFKLNVNGISPLVVYKFTDKASKAIAEKQAQTGAKPKAKRDPHQEYLDALYTLPGSAPAGDKKARYGFPAIAFKKAAVAACRYLDGIAMVYANGAFFVFGEDDNSLCTIHGTPRMRTDAMKIGKFKDILDLRYRPEFPEWSTTLVVRYNQSIMSSQEIVTLFQYAGFHVGVGDTRPSKGYSEGSFEVQLG